MAAEANGKEQARRLFERLWQYDQIVFDLTPSYPGQVITHAVD